MIWLLALRNIIRNKKNSIIIIALISVITFLFFLGNTILSQSERELRKAYIDSLTGDIVIEKKTDVTMSLFGANAPHLEEFFSIQTLPAYNNIVDAVNSTAGIESWTSQVSTVAYSEIFGLRREALICGIDASTYFDTIPGIKIKKGRYLQPGEIGVMITEQRALKIKHDIRRELEMGTPVVFISGGTAGFKIRSVPLVGIYSYQNKNALMQEIVLLDAQTARVLSEIQVASSDVELSEDDVVLLNKDIETLFDEPLFLDSNLEGGSLVDTLHKRLSVDDKPVQNASGDWNFILIRAKSGANVSKIIDELNIKIDPYGSSAVGWRTAAGLAAILVLLLQALYNAGIMIVCAAGIIAIINILLISVFRRTREIGTMRAMGADDKTIRSLLFIENCSLGFLGGIFGIVLGSIAFAVINVMNISVHNDLLAGLLGGSVLHIDFYFGTAALAVLFSLVLSFLSLIIPAETAVRIEPVVAVREG